MSAKADRNIVIGDSSKCSQHAVCVISLHSNRQTLTEENSRTWLTSDRCNSTPELLDKNQRLLTPHSGRFNSDRLEIDTGNYVAVFLYFFFSILLLTRPTQTDWNWPEDGTGRTCLDTWHPMPDIHTSLPGHLRRTIRLFTTERMWFQ
jgi:hypothetical protein